jgi:competence protein ComGD
VKLAKTIKGQQGFTLLELLIVLGAWAVLLLLSVPPVFAVLDDQREKQVLETLKSDVLYMQSLSINSPEERLILDIKQNSYSIREFSKHQPLLKRELPAGYTLDSRTAQGISFTKRGSIKKAGTASLKTKKSKYNIIFPLGKARCYIAKQ